MKKILKAITYYNIIPWLSIICILIFYNEPISNFIYEAANLSTLGWYDKILSRSIQLIIKIGLPCWLCYQYYKHYLSKKYLLLTGRSLGSDKSSYNRTYTELVNYFKNAEPQKLDTAKLPQKKWTESHGLILGKVGKRLIEYVPNKNGIVSFCWGSPGIGKTAAVIIPSARQFGLYKEEGRYIQKAGCMVLDLKGDVYEANSKYRKIKRFTTIDYGNSCHYDPLSEARKMNDDDREIFLADLATILLPYDGSDDGVYFIDVARDFFTGILLYSLNEDVNIGFSDICLKITLQSFSFWGDAIEKSGYVHAQKYINKFKDENEKNVGGGYSKLSKNLTLYTTGIMKTLLTAEGECISPSDLEHCTDVYIQVDPTKMILYGPMVALLFNTFMAAALHRKAGQNPPLAYIIDEFGQLPYMPIIAQAAALMRAYNASILISTQSLAQVEEHYGDKGTTQLMDCARGHAFLSIQDPDTRDWASRLIGTRKVLKMGSSSDHKGEDSGSRSSSEDREKVFEPESFGLLPDDDSVVVYMDGHYVKGQKTYYFKK